MSLVPQVGMVELVMLGILALIVVGPKDLPRLMQTVGRTFGKMRRLADDFRSSFDQMAREAEIDEMRKEIEALKAADPRKDIQGALDDVDRELRETEKQASRPAEKKAEGTSLS